MLDFNSLKKVVGHVGHVGHGHHSQGFQPARHEKPLVGHVGREASRQTDCPTPPDTKIDMSGSLKASNGKASPDMPDMPDTKKHELKNIEERPAAIRAWLASIGETDTAVIGEVLTACRTDSGARDYFAGRGRQAETPKVDEKVDEKVAGKVAGKIDEKS
jgi:hypothetical protein